MLLNAKAAFVSSPDLSTPSPSQTTPRTFCDHVGFLCVPETEDAAVLLLIDLSGAPPPTDVDAVCPWYHLRQAGYPCLLAVLAAPLKAPPPPPTSTPSVHSPVDCLIHAIRKTKDEEEEEEEPTPANETQRTATARSSHSSSAAATVLFSAEDPLYVCVHSGSAASHDSASHPANGEASGDVRWYQLWLPRPSLYSELRALLSTAMHNVSDTNHQRGTALSSPPQPSSASSSHRQFHVVCRDAWPLPPAMPPSPRPLRHAASTPACERRSFKASSAQQQQQQQQQVSSLVPPRRPASALQMNSVQEGSNESSRETSLSINAAPAVVVGRDEEEEGTDVPLWSALADHLRHLARWNTGILTYLFQSSYYLGDALLLLSTTTSDGSDSASRNHLVKNATVHELLRVLFRFWHQTLRAPRVSGSAVPPRQRGSLDGGNDTEGQAVVRGDRHTTASTWKAAGVPTHPQEEKNTNKEGEEKEQQPSAAAKVAASAAEQTSPLLGTPTQISRAFFQETLRKQLQEAQQEQQQQQARDRDGVSMRATKASDGTALHERAAQLPRVVQTTVEAAARQSSGLLLPSPASSQEPSGSIATDTAAFASLSHHLTSVALVEQLLWCIDFSLAYARADGRGRAASRSVGLPILSASVSLEDVWNSFLLQRIQRAMTRGDLDGSATDTPAAASHTAGASGEKARVRDAGDVDLGCSAMDVWRLWTHSSAEVSASDRPFQSTDALRDGSGGGASQLTSPSFSVPSVMPQETASIRDSPADENTQEHQTHSAVAEPVSAAPLTLHQPSPQPTAGAELPSASPPAPPPQPRRAASHVSFSVSDVQQPYKVHATPDAIAAEAAVRAAARHTRERAATPPTPPSLLAESHSKLFVLEAEDGGHKNMKKRGMKGERATRGDHVAAGESASRREEAISRVSGAATAVRSAGKEHASSLLWILPHRYITSVLTEDDEGAKENSTKKRKSDVHGRTSSPLLEKPVQHKTHLLPRPASVPCPCPSDTSGQHNNCTATTNKGEQQRQSHLLSELPSVSSTALPLRGVSVTTATTAAEQCRPPSRIESWDSSTSSAEQDCNANNDNGNRCDGGVDEGDKHTHSNPNDGGSAPAEKSGAAVQPAARTAQPSVAYLAHQQGRSPTLTRSSTNMNTAAASSSSSLIASEHRLFPVIDDDGDDDDGGGAGHDALTADTAAFKGDNATRTVAPPSQFPHSPSRTRDGGCGDKRKNEEEWTAAGQSVVPKKDRVPPRDALHSAASFTTVLAALVEHALAYPTTPSSSSSASPSTVKPFAEGTPSMSAVDAAAAQRGLSAVQRGQLFPSLATMDALNLLPYYVHVWCYTYDPFTQQGRRQRGGGGGGGIPSGGGRSSGGGGGGGGKRYAALTSGYYANASPYECVHHYAHTYLQRYEPGAAYNSRGGGAVISNGGGGGGSSSNIHNSSSSGHGATTQQLLRGFMLHGARTLWRGVKTTAHRSVRDAMGIYSQGKNADGSGGVGGGAHAAHHDAHAFTLPGAQAHGAVYSSGPAPASMGGRDVIKDPSLYYAVCGLYITEQDIIIRSMPTSEVRKRREKARERRRLQRRAQLQQQQKRPQQLQQNMLRRHSVADFSSTARSAAHDTQNEAEALEEDSDTEEAELLLLPRVGLLAVTACPVNRNAGGVFGDKYAHKLFLHQEEQVVALRAHQQQQQHRRRQQLRHQAASAVGLADLPAATSPITAPHRHSPDATLHRDTVSNRSSGGVDSGGSGRTLAEGGSGAGVRTHTTLMPYVEEMINCAHTTQNTATAAAAAAPPQSPASTTGGYAATSKALALGSTLKAAVTGGTVAGRRDGRRAGVQRYFTSLFRQTADDSKLRSDDCVEDAETAATSVAASAQRADSRATATAASPASSPAAESAVGGGVFVSPFTQSPGPHDTALPSHLDESATAAALAAAASVLTSSSQLVSSQPTLVLKIESKAMPTVWLEFADVTTLTYVHRLLETPLRSAAASNALTRAETATQPNPAACKTASAASGVTSAPVEERPDTQHSDDHHQQQQQKREESQFPSFALTSRLSPLGNRFLSSARRHPSMTALVLIAAGVLPRGAAASPFMQAFLRNVSVASTMLRCASTAGVAVRCPRPFNAAENREDREDRVKGEGDGVREAGRSAPRSLHHTKDKATSSSTVATGTAAATACVSLADTWWLYHPAREFRRLGLSADRWAITTANSDFSFCPTYPSQFIVPATVAEAMEAGEISGQHRLSNRMESLVFYYAPTGGALVRSAQPAIARLFMNSAAPSLEVGALMPATRRSGEASGDGEAAKKDCRQRAANTSRMGGDTAAAATHATTTTSSASTIPLMDVPFLVLNALAAAAGVSPHQLVVMDLRTVTAAYANMMRGGGTVDMLLYPFGAVEYAGLANIHEIRRAWLRLRAAVLDVPYTLTCDGGAAGRRETVYVLRAGEPPYAAVVAAAERWVGGSSTRPPPTAASVGLPSSQVKRSGGRNAAAPSCAPASTMADQKQPQQQQQLYDSGAFAGGSSLTQIDSESDESSHRDRCLDVVQQAATAARSNTTTTPPTAAASPSRDSAAHRSTADAENESVDAACSEGEEDSAAAFPPPPTNSSRPSFFSFSRSTDKTAGGSSAISTAASMLSTTSAAAAAAAAETTNAAQQEWLGHLCGLLNTAIVAARRVSGVPTDPLYVPAMAHNGTTPNCFSYVVGHAFTRFWLPSRASEARHGRHTRTATTTPSANHTAAAAGLHSGSHTSSSWWRSVPEARAWPHKFPSPPPTSSFPFPSESQAFDVAPASFEHSADRSLAQVVLVNCSDGWDRTAQISILTQLLLDPYYRTVEGLCVLLERELVCFGHPLQRRSTMVQGNANGGWEASDPKASENPQEEGRAMTATQVRVPTDGAEPLTAPPTAPDSNAHDAQQQQQQESVDAQRDHGSHGDDDGPVHRAASPHTPKESHKQQRQEEKEEERREQAQEDAAGKDAAADGNADCSDSSEEDEDNLDSWLRRNGGWSALDCTDADNTNTVQTADDGAALVPQQQQRQGLQKQSWEAFWRQGANALSSGALGLWNAESLKPSSTSADNHRYSKRSGAPAPTPAAAAATSTSLRDASPIVAQLLDALYQLVRLYPACFEFTEQFVVLLLDLLHCGLVSTFAVNSEKQVRDENVTQGTLSLSQWCALLLSTTTTAGSAPHVYDEPRQDDDMIASPSVHPHELQRQAQQPLTPSPTSSISGYGGRGGGGGDSGSLTATASSVGGSFQRLDSRFLLGDGASRDDNHDADDGDDDDDGDEGTEEEAVSSGSARPPPSQQQQQSASTPPSLLPGGKCDRGEGLHRNDRRTSSSSTSAAAMARGLSHFDCSTAWQPGGHDTTRRATRGGSSSNSHGSSTTDAFTQRLLPISADALYTSGYLNPEFSLRYNKHSVGPLVDFVLPSHLTLWRSAYSRHSFWGTRQHQLQRGVGQARLEGATLRSPYVDQSDVVDGHGGSGGVGGGVASRLSSSWSSSPELGRAVDGAGQRRSDSTHTAAFSASVPYDGREKISRSSSCLYYTHSPSHGDLSQRLADSGGGVTRRGDGAVQTRSGATTGGSDVPFLGATPPGMMNFHLGSDSDEEGNEVEDTEHQRW